MKIKKIFFGILWLTIPIDYIFSQQSTEEKDLSFDINSRNPIYESYKPAEKNFLIDNYSVLPNKDDSSVISDAKIAFWSIDFGVKHINEGQPNSIAGYCNFSLGHPLGSSWYFIPQYSGMYTYLMSDGTKRGYASEISVMFGAYSRINIFDFMTSYGVGYYFESKFWDAQANLGLSLRLKISERYYFTGNCKIHVWSYIQTPFRIQYYSIGIQREFTLKQKGEFKL